MNVMVGAGWSVITVMEVDDRRLVKTRRTVPGVKGVWRGNIFSSFFHKIVCYFFCKILV